MDDLDLFEGPKESIRGAKHFIHDLEALCAPFANIRDYEIAAHIDPNTRHKIVKIRLKHRFPPKIRDLASDIIKKMRLTLDQAFCDAAILLGRANAKGIYFPFGRTIPDLEKQVIHKCQGVDKRLVDYCLTLGRTMLWEAMGCCGLCPAWPEPHISALFHFNFRTRALFVAPSFAAMALLNS